MSSSLDTSTSLHDVIISTSFYISDAWYGIMIDKVMKLSKKNENRFIWNKMKTGFMIILKYKNVRTDI